MKKVVVASTNPVKLEVAKRAFGACFPGEDFDFECVKAVSGVSDQPLSDEETLRGAHIRIASTKALAPDADFYIGLEGGVEDVHGELHEFAWVVVESREGTLGKGKSATFFAPPEIRRLILEEGKELGDAADIVFGDSNSKQKQGAIGHLTRGVIDRAELYRHAAVFALLPFIQEELY